MCFPHQSNRKKKRDEIDRLAGGMYTLKVWAKCQSWLRAEHTKLFSFLSSFFFHHIL